LEECLFRVDPVLVSILVVDLLLATAIVVNTVNTIETNHCNRSLAI